MNFIGHQDFKLNHDVFMIGHLIMFLNFYFLILF